MMAGCGYHTFCITTRIFYALALPEPFFYLDPPYVGTDQGHYDGYTQMDFDALLRALESPQGEVSVEFLRNAALEECSRKNGWYTVEYRIASAMTHGRGRMPRSKVEVLTANYPIQSPGKDRKK
ncbi:MAG: hypothetical protein LBE17_08075 [Treponema sp.]|jgi:DNA adenine methylase|nr:hypothetical protein [Treponema sp.]